MHNTPCPVSKKPFEKIQNLTLELIRRHVFDKKTSFVAFNHDEHKKKSAIMELLKNNLTHDTPHPLSKNCLIKFKIWSCNELAGAFLIENEFHSF